MIKSLVLVNTISNYDIYNLVTNTELRKNSGSFTLESGENGEFYVKKLNFDKINNLYSKDYKQLWANYYNTLSKIMPVNKSYGIVETDSREYFEISKKIDSSTIMNNGNSFEWKSFFNLFQKTLQYTTNLEDYCNKTGQQIGFDSSIWNFTINGLYFDLNPPRMEYSGALFARNNDFAHQNRTIFRNYNSLGIKTNTLATTILGMNKNFFIKDIPKNWLDVLCEELKSTIKKDSEREYFDSYLNGEDCVNFLFNKHPLEIIRDAKESLLKE